ncbi:unnamed protein product, partial [Iphiclides podalirius]
MRAFPNPLPEVMIAMIPDGPGLGRHYVLVSVVQKAHSSTETHGSWSHLPRFDCAVLPSHGWQESGYLSSTASSECISKCELKMVTESDTLGAALH